MIYPTFSPIPSPSPHIYDRYFGLGWSFEVERSTRLQEGSTGSLVPPFWKGWLKHWSLSSEIWKFPLLLDHGCWTYGRFWCGWPGFGMLWCGLLYLNHWTICCHKQQLSSHHWGLHNVIHYHQVLSAMPMATDTIVYYHFRHLVQYATSPYRASSSGAGQWVLITCICQQMGQLLDFATITHNSYHSVMVWVPSPVQ